MHKQLEGKQKLQFSIWLVVNPGAWSNFLEESPRPNHKGETIKASPPFPLG